MESDIRWGLKYPESGEEAQTLLNKLSLTSRQRFGGPKRGRESGWVRWGVRIWRERSSFSYVSEDFRRDADARRRRGGEDMGRTAAWMLPHGGKQCHAICDFFGYGSVFASASTSFLTRVRFGMYGGVYEWFERQEFWILCAVHSCRLFFLGAPHQTV